MSMAMSMVALKEQGEISPSGISAAWGKRWPDRPQPSDVAHEDCIYSYQIEDYDVICGLMQAPIPVGAVELACLQSKFWPESAEEMREQRRHVIVTVNGGGDPVKRMHILTQATIALTDACPAAMAVLWCSSGQLLPPAVFASVAGEFTPHEPVLPIWVNILSIHNEDGSSAGFTQGLAAFDLMEFETLKTPESPEALQARLYGLAGYVIANGPVIKDGDTIGTDASERIKVIYSPPAFEQISPSLYGPDRQVMRLEYDASQSSDEKLTTYGRLHFLGTVIATLAFGYFLYSVFPYLRDSYFRHVILIPLVCISGFFLLILSDNFFRLLFGWEAFDKPKL